MSSHEVGLPPAFPPSLVVQVKALACELPHRLGLPLSRLSIADIRQHVITQGLVAEISGATLWRWLSSDALRPWQHRSGLFPRDPDFAAKAGRVLDLYERVWEDTPLAADDFVISADEKTSVQARRRKQPTLPPASTRPMRVEHEYFREGAWTYLAAWEVHRAKVFGRCEVKTASGSSGLWTIVPLIAGRKPLTISAPNGPTPFLSTPRSMPVGSTRSRSTSRSFREKSLRPTISVRWPNSNSVSLLSRPTTNAARRPSSGLYPQKSPGS